MARRDNELYGVHSHKRIGARPTAMGPQKYKNEQFYVESFLWKARCGSKKNENGPDFLCRSVFFLWPPTEMRSFL